MGQCLTIQRRVCLSRKNRQAFHHRRSANSVTRGHHHHRLFQVSPGRSSRRIRGVESGRYRKCSAAGTPFLYLMTGGGIRCPDPRFRMIDSPRWSRHWLMFVLGITPPLPRRCRCPWEPAEADDADLNVVHATTLGAPPHLPFQPPANTSKRNCLRITFCPS